MPIIICVIILFVVLFIWPRIKKRFGERAATLGYGSTCTSTSALYQHVRLFQNICVTEDEDIYYFNEMFLEKYNLLIMSIGITRNYLAKEMSKEGAAFLMELDDEEIEELMPPVYCSDADIIERHFKNKPVEYYIHCNTMPIKLEPPD